MRNVTPKMVAVVAFVAMVALAAPARAQYVIGTRDSLTARVDSIFSASLLSNVSKRRTGRELSPVLPSPPYPEF